MTPQQKDEIQSAAMGLLLFEQWTLTQYRDFAYGVIELCKAYEALHADNARLRDANYELLSIRHGSLSPRVSEVE